MKIMTSIAVFTLGSVYGRCLWPTIVQEMFDVLVFSFFALIVQHKESLCSARGLFFLSVCRCRPPLSKIVFRTLNHATCYVYSPKAFETLTQGKCYRYWFLKSVIQFFFFFSFIEALDLKRILGNNQSINQILFIHVTLRSTYSSRQNVHVCKNK